MKQTDFVAGSFLSNLHSHHDNRGQLVKYFDRLSHETFTHFRIAESFYTNSKKNVLRGMHLQRSKQENYKIIHVVKGEITDVLLDLRKESSTFLQFSVHHLTSEGSSALFVPDGVAHGYLTLENETIVLYAQSAPYDPVSEEGILFSSFGYSWNCTSPILSTKDLTLSSLEEYLSTRMAK